MEVQKLNETEMVAMIYYPNPAFGVNCFVHGLLSLPVTPCLTQNVPTQNTKS